MCRSAIRRCLSFGTWAQVTIGRGVFLLRNGKGLEAAVGGVE
jgi:hypothetical protein